jgi:RecA-family ATPase
MESIEPVLYQRISAILKARPDLNANRLFCLTLRGFRVSLTSLNRLAESLVDRNFSVVVLDPICKLLGGRNENSAGDIVDLLADIDKLALKSKAAIVFGQHFSKGNQASKESIDRASGSGVWGRDPDSVNSMTKHEKNDHFTIESHAAKQPSNC